MGDLVALECGRIQGKNSLDGWCSPQFGEFCFMSIQEE